ncbi:MAG: phosphoribosylaminoimidazole carboxylase [Nitrospira bacterium SG8_3]|nr:MAG: phosphoribosylaminoimidazole carboxylase [Nitrospira bacterium SG8_3]
MKRSLLEKVPQELPNELIEVLCSSDCVKIERIVSRGHSSPKELWYNQETNEFVLVVQGRAGLLIYGEDDMVILEKGDYVNIQAHVKHRVAWTDPEEDTVWLAVHY